MDISSPRRAENTTNKYHPLLYTRDWRFYFDMVLVLLTRTYLLSPSWEANRFSTSQEIPHILRNPKVHYRVYNSPPPVSILSQINPVHAPSSHFLKFHLYVIISSTPGSSKWPPSLRFPHQNPAYVSPRPHTCYMTCPSHASRFDDPNNI